MAKATKKTTAKKAAVKKQPQPEKQFVGVLHNQDVFREGNGFSAEVKGKKIEARTYLQARVKIRKALKQ
jgi:hypothetical protein